MRVPALCNNCEAIAEPAYTCRMCGAIVCRACFDVNSGTCEICAMKFRRRGTRPGGPSARKH